MALAVSAALEIPMAQYNGQWILRPGLGPMLDRCTRLPMTAVASLPLSTLVYQVQRPLVVVVCLHHATAPSQSNSLKTQKAIPDLPHLHPVGTMRLFRPSQMAGRTKSGVVPSRVTHYQCLAA